MGRSRPSPAFCPLWAPPGLAVSTPPGLPQPGTELACRGARTASNPDFHRSASSSSAARPRRALGPGRSPPPGTGPARPGLRVPPPGLATTLGPGPGRLGFRLRGGRPRAYLNARGSSCGCCLGSRAALTAQAHGAAGY